MKAQKFLESKERKWIKAIGKDKWLKEKVYFTYEVIEFLKEFEIFLSNESKIINNEQVNELPCFTCKYYGHKDYCCYCDGNYSGYTEGNE